MTAIMKPRVEIVAVEASTDIRTFVRAVSESGYSRIPVNPAPHTPHREAPHTPTPHTPHPKP